MELEDAQGIIETRSGTWEWKVTVRRGWPKSVVTGKRLRFKDPVNEVNRMSLELEMEIEDLSEEAVRRLSLLPLKRRFEDDSGAVWIAHPVEDDPALRDESAGRISLHNLVRGTWNVDLPVGRTLGDMKNEELVAWLEGAATEAAKGPAAI
ncbi:MAG: hypothetical protein Q8W45_09760 [Candidatus Palauibacterales bacterium]|nr:hypothetical protein [Candidatus Palauibacterales bacterium]